MKTVIVEGLPCEEIDDSTPPCAPTKFELLQGFDAHIRARLAVLSRSAYWRVFSNPGLVYLLDLMSSDDRIELYEQVLKATDYAVRREEWKAKRQQNQA